MKPRSAISLQSDNTHAVVCNGNLLNHIKGVNMFRLLFDLRDFSRKMRKFLAILHILWYNI